MKDITFTENKNREKKGSPWYYIFSLLIPRQRVSMRKSVQWLLIAGQPKNQTSNPGWSKVCTP